jgi:prolyl 4-hydroxylase
MQELLSKAKLGDPRAELQLAFHYSQLNQSEQSLHWLNQSIAQDHPEAIHTLAVWRMQGHLVDKHFGAAVELLSRGDSLGHHNCSNLLAVCHAMGIGVSVDWARAVELLINSAMQKNSHALRQLAVLMDLTGEHRDTSNRLMFQAILYGDIPARYLMALRMQREQVPGFGKDMAYLLLQDAAKLQFPLANRALQAFGGFQPANTAGFDDQWANLDWRSIAEFQTCRSALSGTLELPFDTPERIAEVPDVRVFRNSLPSELCDYLKVTAHPQLRHSSTVDTETGELVRSKYRTSSSMAFAPVLLDLVVHIVNCRYAQLLGAPLESGEILSVLRYKAGEDYKAHSDYFVLSPEAKDELERSGQRIHTLFSTLEEAAEGGSTTFPKVDLTIKVKKGDTLCFRNVLDNGDPDTMSIHQGDRVLAGEKWLAVKWFRSKTYQL